MVNGVAAHPLRLTAVEDAVAGKPRNAATGEMAGKMAIAGRRAAAVQRLQGSADAEPGEARDSWRGGTNVGVIEWAQQSLGPDVPIHIAFYLMWVAAIGGSGVFDRARHLRALFREAGSIRRQHVSPAVAARYPPKKVARHSLAARLFHWIMAAAMFALLITAFLPRVGVSVSLGDLPLDRRPGADSIDHLPHHPCDLLHGFLVHLAGQGRHRRRGQ